MCKNSVKALLCFAWPNMQYVWLEQQILSLQRTLPARCGSSSDSATRVKEHIHISQMQSLLTYAHLANGICANITVVVAVSFYPRAVFDPINAIQL